MNTVSFRPAGVFYGVGRADRRRFQPWFCIGARTKDIGFDAPDTAARARDLPLAPGELRGPGVAAMFSRSKGYFRRVNVRRFTIPCVGG